MVRLSTNFTLSELIKSQTCERHGIDNTPNKEQIINLRTLCENILEPVRSHYGVAITPSSGFRCVQLCEIIGSSARSQHTKGEAVDFEVAGIDNYECAKWIESNLTYDQLILECYRGGNTGWIHCSFTYKDAMRGESLTYDGKNYVHGLVRE